MQHEQEALQAAVTAGNQSPCVKSKRGVVLFSRETGIMALGFNHPPSGFGCDGSPACQTACGKICIHAEMDALTKVVSAQGLEMLHVKVVDGKAVASGPPSCWQCSRHVVEAGITRFWLLHDDGLRSYGAEAFHEATLRHVGLPVIR